MRESEILSDLIGDIYDTTFAPTQWVGVIGKCAQFVGGPAAALFSKDFANKTGEVYYDDGGIDPFFRQLYFEKYIKFDPTTTGHCFAQIGEPVAVADILPREEFLETRFYKEWVRPQGLGDALNVALDKTATSVAMFCVFRRMRDGWVDEEMRRRMRLIVPHMRRSVLIGKVIDLKRDEATTFSDVIDSLSGGMFFVNETMAIVHASASGLAMLASGDVLSKVGGRLAASDPQSDEALRTVLAAASMGDAAVGVAGIAQPLIARDGERYVAHVLPLTSGARRRTGKQYDAVAVVFVRKMAFQLPSAPEVIAKIYNLTPSELRVLLAIVQVGGVPEAAEALGIADSTVRTHLIRVFSKTGASRQADLVKIIAEFSNPLIS